MSLKLRLALWYAGLTTAVVLGIVATAYVIHGRSQYLDVDTKLAGDAAEYVPVLRFVAGDAGAQVPSAGPTSFVQLYDAHGVPIDGGGASPQPPLGPLATVAADAGPAYGPPLRWLPGGGIDTPGHFATVRDPGGHRVRVYAQRVATSGALTGYVETWASLEATDASMVRFRQIMLGLAITSVIAVGLLGRAIAGLALRPVSTMIATAQANATLRGFGRRVPEPHPERHDELSTLARTFNEMLDSLQGAYVAQQRFIADAAHELRAPLTAIRGNIELLERVKDMPAEDREEALGDLQRESLRLLGLVEQLLQLARSDAGLRVRFRPVELDAVLLQAIADMRSLPGASRLELNSLVPLTVRGDADRLRQLITILLDNAYKYTPAGGRIHTWLLLDRSDAVLRVQDSGVGISAADLPHVFERFFRADPARSRDPGGSGLGLPIAKSIVDQHGGQIDIVSVAGAGTTVTVRLPVLTPRTGARDPGVDDDAAGAARVADAPGGGAASS